MAEQAAGSGNSWLSDLKGLLAPIVGFLVLLGFSGLIIHMLGQVAVDETQWTRAVYLFAGVESIAFAAAGFFFGSEVRRQQAESAQERADEARVEADAAKEEAVAGRTLAAAIRAEKVGLERKAVGPLMGLETEGMLQTVQADFEMLQALADELFPPRD